MLQIFKMFPEFDPMPENELQFSRKLIKLLIDWGKNGKPPQYLSDWKRFDVENPSYLVIDEEFKIEKGTPDSQRLGKSIVQDFTTKWQFTKSQLNLCIFYIN